jgi:hypothetical protein
VAEQGCLLSSYPGKTGIGGSNPPLSAKSNINDPRERINVVIYYLLSLRFECWPFGKASALLSNGKLILASYGALPQALQLCVSRYNVRATNESVPRAPSGILGGNASCAR